MHPIEWLARHDHGYAALRRAARAAIVMPAMFALGARVIGDADVATFAAFGSFAMLLLVDFGGPMRERLQAQAALAVTGGVLVCLGTLASGNAWLAAAAMAVVGFVLLLSGVVSSVLASATTALLLAFILPVSLAGSVSSVPARLAGWALASVAAFAAVALLWPAPAKGPLRAAAIIACRALAGRLRAGTACLTPDVYLEADQDHSIARSDQAVAESDQAVAALRTVFLATPYRPTGLSTVDRTIVRLVDEVSWLNGVVVQGGTRPVDEPVDQSVLDVRLAACTVLERGAQLLASTGGDPADLRTAISDLDAARSRMEQDGIGRPEFISSLEPGFRAQELSFAAAQIGRNIELAVAAERRSWMQRLLGHQPEGVTGPLAAARERAGAHFEWHSVWLHNSVRAAAGLGLAVLVANLTGVQHSFWVVLGTLSVLRSNALSTGQNVVRGLLGTLAGFVIGAILLALIGTSPALLWVLLPPAILLAGVAPAAISFAAGQAGFTLVLVILFNIIQPAGWRVGLLRVEDITIGCAVSLVVGLLFWPRGARGALRRALAEAYSDSARYLATAVDYGMSRSDQPVAAGTSAAAPVAAPVAESARAADASRRLDDAFRTYLAERGGKPVSLARAAGLVTGVVGVRLAADAVLDLWQRDFGGCSGTPVDRSVDGARDGSAAGAAGAAGDRGGAWRELLAAGALVRDWYDELAATLLDERRALPEPLAHDQDADGRLVAAVRHDLGGADGRASATAVRMIWTGDHVDAVRRLQPSLVDAVRPDRRSIPAEPD